MRARVCECAQLGRPRIRADTCEGLPSAWTVGGSGRRHSAERWRSTRISARGTPRHFPCLPGYAPAFRPGCAPLRRDALGRVFDAVRAVVRSGSADARVRVCLDVWARACAGVQGCRYSCACERRLVCMYGYICIYKYAIYMYMSVYMYLCERWVWACMWLHRLACTRACDCARRQCGRCHHVRAWVRPLGYIANTHVMYTYSYIYIYISMQSPGYVNGYACVLLHTRAIACGR